jgi:predicted phage terminase large subunit-like protein
MSDWTTFYRGCYNPDGTLFFPERLTQEFLDSAKKLMGSRYFSNQYLNVVIDDQDKPFKAEWLKYYEQIPTDVYRFIFVDPAISQSDSADYTAVVVVAVDKDQQWYLEHASKHKITPTNIINLLFQLTERYNPLKIGIEDVAFQKVLVYMCHEEMQRRNIWMPVEGIKPPTDKTKLMKILGLTPRFEWGRILINKGLFDFEDEYRNYAGERSKHDDVLDALSSIEQIANYPTEKKEEIKDVHPSDPMYEHYYRLKLARGDFKKREGY